MGNGVSFLETARRAALEHTHSARPSTESLFPGLKALVHTPQLPLLRRDCGEASPRRVAPGFFWFLTSFSAQKQRFPYENDVSMCINPVGHDAPVQQSSGGTT